MAGPWRQRRAILAEALREPADAAGLFTELLGRFAVLSGVDLDLPERREPAFVTAWVAIALVYIAMSRKNTGSLPEITESNLRPIAADAIIWVIASAIGIYLASSPARPTSPHSRR